MLETLLLTVLLSANAPIDVAADTNPDATTLEMLAIDLRALARITEMADSIDDHDGLMRRIVDDRIHQLRSPRPDGSYRWASLQREEASRDSSEVKVERVFTESTLNSAKLDAHDGYRVEIEVPRKKSLFSNNERIFVSRIVLSGVGVREETIPASVWIEPEDSWGVPLPEIVKSGEVIVELGVEAGGKSGVANVSIVRAKLVDDPANPYFPAVSRLLGIREELVGRTDRSRLQRSIDEALATIPGEVDKTLALERARALERQRLLESGTITGTIRPGDATTDVLSVLDRIRKDLKGTLQEQEQARQSLDELIETLSPPSPE